MERSKNFSLITDLRKRVTPFIEKKTDFIKPFYDKKGNIFTYSIDDKGNPDSIQAVASTAQCVTILVEWDEISHVCKDKKKIVDSLLKSKWESGKLPEYNAFTLGLLLPALYELGVKNTERKVNKSLTELKKKISSGKGGISLHEDAEKETRSTFLTYWALYALYRYDTKFRTTNLFKKVIEWAESEVYRQIVYFHSGESDYKNIQQLVFGWSICKCFPDRSPLSQTVSQHILDLIFNDQNKDGVWPLYYPLFNFPRVGSAYVHHFQLIQIVLEVVNKDPMVLSKYLENITRIINWAETRLIKHESGINGWSITTDPTRRHKPISWATIQMLNNLCILDKYLSEIQREMIFQIYTGTTPRSCIQEHSFDEMLDINIPGEKDTVRSVIEKNIIKSIPMRLSTRTLKGQKQGLTVLLFGPPGSSKTTIAEVVSCELGWPLLKINPGHFVPKKNSGLEMRVIEVFSDIEKASDCVILLDEMEELLRERKSEGSDRVGRFWTTLMLPILSRLRSKANSIIFIATNHIQEMDVAAIRPARIDIILPVGPPNVPAKLKWMDNHFKLRTGTSNGWYTSLDQDRKECFKKVMYGELIRLANKIGKSMTKDKFSSALAWIKPKLQLSDTDKDSGDEYWDIFLKTSSNCCRLP